MTPWTVPTRLLCPWDFPCKNTGVDCHFLLQGFFLTWNLPDLGIKPASPSLQTDSLPLSNQGIPPFSLQSFLYAHRKISSSELFLYPILIYNSLSLPHFLLRVTYFNICSTHTSDIHGCKRIYIHLLHYVINICIVIKVAPIPVKCSLMVYVEIC